MEDKIADKADDRLQRLRKVMAETDKKAREPLGPGVGPFCVFLGLGFPYNPLQTQKMGTLSIPRLLPGLDPKP